MANLKWAGPVRASAFTGSRLPTFKCLHTIGPRLSLRSSKLRQLTNEAPSAPSRIHPSTPARTRFAPSPTGQLHLGSLRTALYNYLLAKNTGGQFLLRLEDTDQTRLVPGAEQNMYDMLRWAGIVWDEGPEVGGPYGPYRQSDRKEIYAKHADKLMESGHAYRCFCSKDRLNSLRESAKKLHPPSLASYDRKCANISPEESAARAQSEEFTLRFKAPLEYPEFTDLFHGAINLQTQINYQDTRYEDPVLMKSDGLPTYHFANIVDDHLMHITHVIRGEEWLLSSPKHVALYKAMGWNPPNYVHIPLLTSISERKLSKRSGDSGIAELRAAGVLPEALVNFVALYGWSAGTEEFLTMEELISQFSLDGLTKGNAKVDNRKLNHFNKLHFARRLDTQREQTIHDIHREIGPLLKERSDIPDSLRQSHKYLEQVVDLVHPHVHSIPELAQKTAFLFRLPDWQSQHDRFFKLEQDRQATSQILEDALKHLPEGPEQMMDKLIAKYEKKQVFQTLRYALAGGVSGLRIPQIIDFLGPDITKSRLSHAH